MSALGARMVCSMGAFLYEPINVYKPVAPIIGIVDGPFEHLTVGGVKLPLPFTTRMTVVRLSTGDLFLHSPIKFTAGLANELLGLGAVRHLVSPNQFHYAHIGEWAKAFPDAVSWAPSLALSDGCNGLRARVRRLPPRRWWFQSPVPRVKRRKRRNDFRQSGADWETAAACVKMETESSVLIRPLIATLAQGVSRS